MISYSATFQMHFFISKGYILCTYQLWWSTYFCFLFLLHARQGRPAGLLASVSGTGPRIEPNHTQADLFTTVPLPHIYSMVCMYILICNKYKQVRTHLYLVCTLMIVF
jgi:hypothetical protein